ncbi:MAG: hypothetical protein V1934_03880 [Methanobacteriota archaeon]
MIPHRGSLYKLAALLVALSALAATLTLVPPRAKAADTPNEWFDFIPGAPPSTEFHDVVWTPDGKNALWVGMDISLSEAIAWWYTPDTGTWVQSICVDDPGYVVGMESGCFYTACYMEGHPSFGNCFLVMGNCGADGVIYIVQTGAPAQLVEQHWPTVANFWAQGSIYNPTAASPCIEVVGFKTGIGAFCYEYSVFAEDFGAAAKCSATAFGTMVWYDVELDTSLTPPDVYFVGKDGLGGGLYQCWDTSANGWVALGIPPYFVPYCIDYDAKTGFMVTAGYSPNAAYTCLYYILKGSYFDSWYWISESLSSTAALRDIDFDVDGKGVAVGEWSASEDYGLVVDIWWDAGTYVVVQRSDESAIYYQNYLYGVAIVPFGNPMALISGTAFKYYYNAASSNIQVDTIFPHIDYVDLYDAGTTTSRLNSQIDVDPGDDSTWYDLEVRTWHNSGKGNIVSADVYMWYDWGAGENIPAPFDNGGWENTRIHLRWTRGTPDSWILIYPFPGNDETTIDNAACSRVDDGASDNVTLRFRFSPHQQVRFAPGGFSEGPGVRYGAGNPEDQSDPLALNDLDSWNIQADVYDVGGAQASAYDEFGFYKYTYLGTSGLPGGGNVIGSGPPNTVATLSPTAEVVYSSNCPYQLAVSSTDLIGQNFAGTIAATRIGVMGGQIGGTVYLTGAGVPMYLWGNAVPTYQAPNNWYRTTTISSPGGWQVTWYCDIPGVVEDYYRGTITYSIWHG